MNLTIQLIVNDGQEKTKINISPGHPTMQERKKPRWRAEPVKRFFYALREYEMLISSIVLAVAMIIISLLRY